MVLKVSDIEVPVNADAYFTDENGTVLPVDRIQFEGVTVWERTSVPAGTVIFQSSTPNTYSVEIPVDGNYQIIAVGGGGAAGTGQYMTLQITAPGYGGGYINVYKYLTAGTYTAVVADVTPTVGTVRNTTFDGLVAGGGHLVYPNQTINTITNDVSSSYQVNNNVTDIMVGASNYGGYGKGGVLNGAGATPGYLYIVKI